ncbi:protein FAM8A1 [Chironomus tepperi]|uniref:protein FAM8A1 n=1 Tax=Chironomus tepperi TaxID=113505 RepID=UPI00391F6FDF
MENEQKNMESPENPDSKKTELSKEKYFELLQEWVNLQNAFRAMTYFPLLNQSLNTGTESTQNHQSIPRPINTNQRLLGSTRWFDPARAEELIRINGGYDLVISPLYKRFLSEVLDCIILFVIKIIVLVVLIDLFDVNITLDLDIADIKDMKFLEDDYSQLLNLSSEFIVLEIITKLISCLYEAVFYVNFGATIGKLVLGIRVIHADAVIPLEQQVNHSQGIRALIFPATNLTFFRALMRSFAKNLMVTLLFPVYFMLFFYKFNQLIYDMLCKSVVVEYNPNPVLRRRN